MRNRLMSPTAAMKVAAAITSRQGRHQPPDLCRAKRLGGDQPLDLCDLPVEDSMWRRHPSTVSCSSTGNSNGHVEALHKTILDECWRPAFARYLYPRYSGLRRELDTYLSFYNTDRVHHGRLTGTHPRRHRLRCPQDGGKMSRTCRHISEAAHPRPGQSRI